MNPELNRRSQIYNTLFKTSMMWRTFYGTLKVIFGLILLRILTVGVPVFFNKITESEFFEDPNDFFIGIFNIFSEKISVHTGVFIAFYLIFWGIVDGFFSFYILKKKLWAYPSTLLLIGGFTFYELYRFFHTHSLTLLFVILIDLVIFVLIHKEYIILKKEIASRNTN